MNIIKRLRRIPWAIIWMSCLIAQPALADIAVTPGTGTTVNVIDFTGSTTPAGTGRCASTNHCPATTVIDTAGIPVTGAAGSPSVSAFTIQGIGSGTPVTISGSLTNITGTVTLPTGAATAANQATEISSLASIVTNTASAIPTQAPTVSIGGVGIIDSAGTNVASVKAASTPAAATDKSLVVQANPDQPAIALWGQGTTGATTPTSATAAGCNGVSAFPTAVTTGQMAVPTCDLDGSLITRLWAPKARWVSGVTSAMTGTSSTQMIAAVASNRIYLTTITCGNSHATVGTFVNVQDGSGGTTLWTVPAAAVYGGAVNPIVPPVFTTSGNGVYVVDATTGANVICSGSGYSGP